MLNRKVWRKSPPRSGTVFASPEDVTLKTMIIHFITFNTMIIALFESRAFIENSLWVFVCLRVKFLLKTESGYPNC